MRPTQCKHSFFLVGETGCWRRTKYADIPTAAYTFPGSGTRSSCPRNQTKESPRTENTCIHL